jgi:hypothetical protein
VERDCGAAFGDWLRGDHSALRMGGGATGDRRGLVPLPAGQDDGVVGDSLAFGGHRSALPAGFLGVETEDEIMKYLLAGADVVMTASALLKHGVRYIKVLLEVLKDWLASRDLDSVELIRGRLSQRNISDPTAFERANCIKILQGYDEES